MVFWVVIAASSLIISLITASNVSHHMLWVTSIFGSYLLIISVTLFVDRWPVDLNLPALEQAGAVVKTEPNFYIYMIIWIAMSAFGVLFQCLILCYYKNSGKPVHFRI